MAIYATDHVDTKKTIIIAGEWHSSNLGDEVICKTFQYLLQTLLSLNVYQFLPLDISFCRFQKIEKIIRYILRMINKNFAYIYYQYIKNRSVKEEFKKQLKENKVYQVIVPGGEIFQAYFVKCIHILVLECKKNNIPISFNACGYGPNNKKSTRIFQWILTQPCVFQITTRDNIAPLVRKHIKVVPDAAIMAYKYYNFKNHKKRKIIIGINILSPNYYIKVSGDTITYKEFDGKMIEILRLLSTAYTIVIFTNGDPADQKYADSLYSRVRSLNISIEQRPTNGFELIKIIYKCSLVIGFRLHSLIISYSYNIPTIGIAWDNKLYYWGELTENANIYLLSKFPVAQLCVLSNNVMEQGINKELKKKLESRILEQIRTYDIA
jgi:polysaccharide pyruvyl transferase WcaK-like protein